jgi:microcystin-dependent protein
MTVTTTNSKTEQLADGVQDVFPYSFVLPDAAWLQVYYDSTLILSGYTVDGIGDPSGGDVTFTTAPPAGVTVTLLRVAPETQQVDYQPYDSFPAETHEDALDKLTMITQQLQEQINRAVTEPIGGGGGFDMKGGKIVNLATGTANTDGTNVGQIAAIVQPIADDAQQSANEAAASAAAAALSASDADAALDSIVPTYIGEMTLWNDTIAPAEYLLCNGAVYDQADYPELYAAIGTRFNTGGEAGTEFRVPTVVADDPIKTAWIIRAGSQSAILAAPLAAGNDTSAIGTVAWMHSQKPDWLICNGQTVSKAAYPDLWTYAQGFLTANQVNFPGLYVDVDASNFKVPNLAGQFLRGQGGTSGVLGALQSEMVGTHDHDTNVAELNNGDTSKVLYGGGGSNLVVLGPVNNNVGTENRPANVALIPCVRALPLKIDGFWFGSSKFVSAAAPSGATGVDGDFYFQVN